MTKAVIIEVIIIAIIYFHYRYGWVMEQRKDVILAIHRFNTLRMRSGWNVKSVRYTKALEPWQFTFVRFWDYNVENMLNKEYRDYIMPLVHMMKEET